ncbi:hypothetical protein H6G52_09655 [Limnothrix sp. FACHB-881]|uniref:hypothetical protein n=1 Tax=Limnothrix sp. FACHB-881 TaxID=2692819 RepID=UPI0016853D25|nr:hypothetical protein [Limnothrix sp. FACHB-881]MBD2635624.1 hypothetical protein [Limnothrix sp. FACHB-881]
MPVMSFEVLLILILALIFLLQWLDGLDRDRRKAIEVRQKAEADLLNMLMLRKSLADLLKKLAANPGDMSLQQQVLASMRVQEDAKGTGLGYGSLLALFEANSGDKTLRKTVLEAGRIHYGKIAGGVASLDDERRVMNDIAVRS